MRRRLCSALLPAASLLAFAVRAAAADPAPVFEKDILPLFQEKCLRCHGSDTRRAELDLRGKAAMLKGGESGPALSPGSPEKSLLWIKIAADKMPPGKAAKLTDAEKTLVRAWIEAGARDSGVATLPEEESAPIREEDRRFWSFRGPVRPAVPAVRQTVRIRNPIDAFVLAKLEEKGLTFAPEADKATLLRRVTCDLTGLPPTPAEIDAFLKDDSPDAYEKVVDRLLASPHYGEQWARHWLDLAGYADSEGILDADYPRTAAWRYRDYVVRAFNADKPYDRFLKEQIAGDELTDYWTAYHTQKELPPDVIEGLIATGFLRCACDTSRPDFSTIKNAPGYYYQTLDDTLKIVASSTLGLTVQCARCHSHKYDPIPQTEYYRLQAVFMSAYRPYQWVPQVQRRLLEGGEAQVKEVNDANAKVDAAVADLKKQADALTREYADKLFADRLAALPEAIREDVRTALGADPAKRDAVQNYLASKFQKELRPDPPALAQLLPKTYPDYSMKSAALAEAIKAEQAKHHELPEIRALYDLPGEPQTPLLRRGDYLNPGPDVQPGVLTALDVSKPFDWKPPAKDAPTSGRRLAFAEWLTQPDHPLTARVMVNRLWLYHFGEGIVATPDNFGRIGSPPSHPELLDWLATQFVAPSPQPSPPSVGGEARVRGWSIKAMQRLIVTSSAYRQASVSPTAAAAKKIDPDDRLLWRQRMRRLEAESLRDSILAVSGSLNAEMYGPPVPMQRQGDGEVTAPADASGARRSIYLQVRRSQPLTLLQVFDQPVMETNCTRRAVSTTPSQALTLLNSDFLTRQADAFAGRVLKEKPDDPAAYAVLTAFGRPITAKEKGTLTSFLEAQAKRYQGTPDAARRALADLCQMLMSADEFAYVD
ncbi:MAG TPA: PSD1 and planctomycete cytochrome C domain-containing protein [Gemmataceae bacterium]|nr:PSD1 and planctomycete cytochrome C domain-containing protein [Gemmataceae bacterium]